MKPEKPPIVVLISGSGSNLQAIIDAVAASDLAVEIRAVVSNRPGAAGLDRAHRAGIPARVLDHRGFPDRDAFDAALAALVDAYHPALVVLAGFMRVLTGAFVAHYEGRLINIHPSLLPEFPGLDTHRRALAAGVKEHGVSVHFVAPEVDGGPIIAQARVPVLEGDDPDTLARRVLEREHEILPDAIGWFAQGRLEIRGDIVLLDGRPALESPGRDGSP